MARAAPRHVGKQRERVEDMLPLKVNLPSSFEPPNSNLGHMTSAAIMHAACAPPQLSPSQWANAVNSMAPSLNAKGLRRALTILDCAISNVQRAKALDDTSSQTSAGFPVADYQYAAMCAMMQVQIHQQQHLLYQELQQLPYCEGVLMPCGGTGPYVAPQHPHMPVAAGLLPWVPGHVPGTKPAAPASPPKSPSGGPAAAPLSRRRAPQTLSTSLRVLEDEDPYCLLIVRRISKLGFKATRSLKQHFSAYGPVVRVLLAHSTARQYCDQQFQVKRRPSNLGFVQMATAEAANMVLAQGASQAVEGIIVNVQRFERHGEEEDDDGDVGEEEQLHMRAEDLAEDMQQKLSLGRPERGMSDASTATGSAQGSPVATFEDSPGIH